MNFHFAAMPTYYFPPRPQHLDSVRGGPYFAQAPPSSVFISTHDPHLCTTVVKHIEYYFRFAQTYSFITYGPFT